MSDPSTEQEIRWAAYGVLVEDGYDEFTTQAVADEAGVSQSLVHYYFETKEDLVFALFEDGLAHLMGEVEDRLDTADPRERLLGLAGYMLRGEEDEDFDETVDFARLLLEIEAQAPYDDRLRDAVAYDQDFLRDYVAGAVSEGVETGKFRDVDPAAFAAVYVSAIRSAQNWRAIFADDEYTAPVLDGLEAIIEGYLVDERGPG